jgi:hypothetical protein
VTHKAPLLAGRTPCRWWIIRRRGRRIVARHGIISGRCVIGIVRRRLIIYRRWINRWRRYEHRKAEADKDARMSWVRQSGYETKNNAERRNRQRTADATTSRCSVHAPTLRFQMLLHCDWRTSRRSTVCARTSRQRPAVECGGAVAGTAIGLRWIQSARRYALATIVVLAGVLALMECAVLFARSDDASISVA